MDFPERKKLAYREGRGNGGGEFFADLESRIELRRMYPSDGDRWGNWEFAADTLHLVYKVDGRERYAVALKEIDGSAEMLDWIFQLRMKTWITSEDVGELVQAFDDLLSPQATLCGQGVDKALDAEEYIKGRMNAE